MALEQQHRRITNCICRGSHPGYIMYDVLGAMGESIGSTMQHLSVPRFLLIIFAHTPVHKNFEATGYASLCTNIAGLSHASAVRPDLCAHSRPFAQRRRRSSWHQASGDSAGLGAAEGRPPPTQSVFQHKHLDYAGQGTAAVDNCHRPIGPCDLISRPILLGKRPSAKHDAIYRDQDSAMALNPHIQDIYNAPGAAPKESTLLYKSAAVCLFPVSSRSLYFLSSNNYSQIRPFPSLLHHG